MVWFNKRCTVDNIRFDSMKEASRYQELDLLERAGEISGLTLQPIFELAPAVRYQGQRQKPALKYRADFEYRDRRTGEHVVEDVKGGSYRTAVYLVKRHLMMAVHGIEIREVE